MSIHNLGHTLDKQFIEINRIVKGVVLDVIITVIVTLFDGLEFLVSLVDIWRHLLKTVHFYIFYNSLQFIVCTSLQQIN